MKKTSKTKGAKSGGRLDTRSEIGRVLKEAVVPINFSDLDEKRRRAYVDMAKSILESEVFQNEKSMLFGMWTHHIATQCKDYDQVRDFQMCIYALETFTDRLNAVASVGRKPEPADDPFEAI
jgi:hypothetical protein